ncbi:MAG: hypothetical protein ACK5C5_02885 [Bacteroidota bacterium]|jgi:hypothetical protein
MKNRNKKPLLRGRTRQTQRMRMRVVVAAASVVTMLSTMLLLYFQLYKREDSFAKEIILKEGELPTETSFVAPVVAEADTNSRNGVRYKVAKHIPKTVY